MENKEKEVIVSNEGETIKTKNRKKSGGLKTALKIAVTIAPVAFMFLRGKK